MGREKKGERRKTGKGRYNRNRGGRTTDDLRFKSCITTNLKSCGRRGIKQDDNALLPREFLGRWSFILKHIFTLFTPVLFLIILLLVFPPYHVHVSQLSKYSRRYACCCRRCQLPPLPGLNWSAARRPNVRFPRRLLSRQPGGLGPS